MRIVNNSKMEIEYKVGPSGYFPADPKKVYIQGKVGPNGGASEQKIAEKPPYSIQISNTPGSGPGGGGSDHYIMDPNAEVTFSVMVPGDD